jgi:hypothetical protein
MRQTKAGKFMPTNTDGTPHWATCPDVDKFKRAKPAPPTPYIGRRVTP